MKKLLLLAMGISLGIGVSAQTAIPATKNVAPNNQLTKSVTARNIQIDDNNITTIGGMAVDNNTPIVRSNEFATIGISAYDLYSNGPTGNRAYRYEDGTMAAVWTYGSLSEAPSFGDRGTGYNFYDGSSWGDVPTERIEEVRTGWPSYAPWGANGEAVVTHASAGLILSTRATRGSGDWEYKEIQGPEGTSLTWPTMCTSGANNEIIHVFANSYEPYMDQDQALLYFRSTDGGETWEENGTILEGMGSELYKEIRADGYVVKSKGDVVVLMVGSVFNTDIFLMKSEDNGQNWTKQMIFDNPIDLITPYEENTFDTVYTCDGSFGFDIDHNNEVHAVIAITRVIKEEEGTGYNFFPGVEGIAYWKESDGEIIDENDPYHSLDPFEGSVLDNNGRIIGWTPDINENEIWDIDLDAIMNYGQGISLSNWPTIKCGKKDALYVTWCSPHEDYTSGTNNYRHIFGRGHVNGQWKDNFIYVTDAELDMFSEFVWPESFNVYEADENIYLMANKDLYPGLSSNSEPDHEPVDNSKVVYSIPKTTFINDISTDDITSVVNYNVKQNYPNPFNGETTINVQLSESANVKVDVVNIVGQTVYANDYGKMTAGSNNITIDGSSFETGIYFYNVTINEQVVTKKMIVE